MNRTQPEKFYNVLIVTRDASYVSTQIRGTFNDVAKWAKGLDRGWYKIFGNDPVFVASEGERHEYSLDELCREAK